MNWLWQLKKIFILLAFIIAFGVTGLMIIEGWSFLDALYMTVLTMSTVGYMEVRPLSTAGRIFDIALIVLGVGSFLYIITTLAEFVVSGQFGGVLWRMKMDKKIGALSKHYIVCGLGRVGQQVALELTRENVNFVVIDTSETALEFCAEKGFLFIEGDASNDEVLKQAGIMQARGVVTATDSDADNVYITLSARSLNHDLFIVSRANTEKSEYKLIKAGADRVISPYSIGGRRLASLLIRPTVVEFLDIVMHSAEIELLMEEVIIHERSPFVGLTVGDARKKCVTGANILAIKKKGQMKMIPSPSADIIVDKGDRFVALGTREQLRDLECLS